MQKCPKIKHKAAIFDTNKRTMSVYMRVLPTHTVSFSSKEGKHLFKEAL